MGRYTGKLLDKSLHLRLLILFGARRLAGRRALWRGDRATPARVASAPVRASSMAADMKIRPSVGRAHGDVVRHRPVAELRAERRKARCVSGTG